MSLKIPLVYWNSAPKLSFSCVLVCKKKNRIFAGTKGGNCILFTIKQKITTPQKPSQAPETPETPEDIQVELVQQISKDETLFMDFSEVKIEKPQVDCKNILVEPFAVLNGHEAEVTALCEVNYDYTDCVCSVSSDGSFCIWNLNDGLCMASAPFILSGTPTSITALPNAQVAIAGKHNEIEVVDLNSLKVIHKHEGHTEWVTSLSYGNHQDDILLSVSEDRSLRYWMFKKENRPVYVVDTATSKLVAVGQNSDWSYILVVAKDKFIIYTYHSFNPTYTVAAPEGVVFQGGFFIDDFHLLVYSDVGDAFIDQLTKYTPNKIKPTTKEINNVENLGFTTRDYSIDMPRPLKKKPSVKLTLDIKGVPKPSENEESSPLSSGKKVFKDFLDVLGFQKKEAPKSPKIEKIIDFDTETSSIQHHRLSTSEDLKQLRPDQIEKIEVPENEKREPVLIKSIINDVRQHTCWSLSGNFLVRAYESGDLAVTWFHINSDGSVETEVIQTTTLETGWPRTEYKSRITASTFSVDKLFAPKLAYGFQDGSIAIESCFGEQSIVFNGHSKKITSLLVVHDNKRNKRCLVSGSQDFTVKVWDLETGKLLKEFYNHSGHVHLLFKPPKEIETKFQSCFCSVGDDRSVIMYSLEKMDCIFVLGGHSSGVLSVYWRHDLDNLLVRCADGSVYVWQLSTGILDRQVKGKLAAEIIERSEGPGWRKPSLKITFSRQNFYTSARGLMDTLSLPISENEPDVKLIMLSIRELINEVLDTKEDIEQCIKNIKEKPLPYSLTSTLAYIFQYGNNESVKLLREKLGILQPDPIAYMGLRGSGTAISLLVPTAAEKSHAFGFSPVLSSLYSISCVAVLKTFSIIPDLTNLCNACIKYYLLDLPKEFTPFEEPSFLYCSQFLKDPIKDIQLASKAVMDAVIKRLSKEKIVQMSNQLSDMLLECHQGDNSSKKHKIVVALASLLAKTKDVVDSRIQSITAMGLIEILEKGGSQHITAISLLGDGYHVWQYYIPEPTKFIDQLFRLAVPALTLEKKIQNVDAIAIDSLQAFINVANIDPKLYIEFISGFIANHQNPAGLLNTAITSLYPLMHKYPVCLRDYLETVITLVLKVLDPHFINVRDACLISCTNILRYLVEIYPMITFHQETQKLALGTINGSVIIFDIRTASKWQFFDACKSPITALSFSPNGDKLATFSSSDGQVLVWNIDSNVLTNFLGNLVSNRYSQSFTIQTKGKLTSVDAIKHVKMAWATNGKSISLKPGPEMNNVVMNL